MEMMEKMQLLFHLQHKNDISKVCLILFGLPLIVFATVAIKTNFSVCLSFRWISLYLIYLKYFFF